MTTTNTNTKTNGKVLPDLTSILAQLEALKAENEKLKQAKGSKYHPVLKVSAKGAISIYGFGRWPVTLYKQQMETLLGMGDTIKAFIKENNDKLTTKED